MNEIFVYIAAAWKATPGYKNGYLIHKGTLSILYHSLWNFNGNTPLHMWNIDVLITESKSFAKA